MSGEASGTSLLPMVPDPRDRWSRMAGPGGAGNPKAAGEKGAGRERGNPARVGALHSAAVLPH